MNIMARFRRLTFWHKLAAVGSVASILGILVAVALGTWKCITDSADSRKLDELHRAVISNPELKDTRLLEKYPLGYAVLELDGKKYSVTTLWGSDSIGKYAVDWSTTELIDYSDTTITFRAPDLAAADGSHMRGCVLILKSDRPASMPAIGLDYLELWMEIVERRGNYLIAVLGFRSDST